MEGDRTYQSESTMSTHAVTGDTHTASIQLGEGIEDSLGQFFGNIAIHVIARVVGGLSGIDVEASTRTEVIRIILALDVKTA
jgi:hypothetical protein